MELTVEDLEGQLTSIDAGAAADDKADESESDAAEVTPYFDPVANRDPANRDPSNGYFKPGHSIAGPGRPKGSLDYMSICRTKSKAAGVPLEDLVWAATRGLALRAGRGDAAAAKVLLDRLCGPVDKALVEIDARSVGLAAGPPIPGGSDFKDWVAGINRVAAQQGLLGDSTPTEIVDAALAEVQAVEDLLR